MPTTGERLGAVQMRGHAAVDAIYAPVSRDVEDTVRQHAKPDTDGILRLSSIGLILALTDIGRVLDRARPALFHAIQASVGEAIAVAQIDADPLPRADVMSEQLEAYQPISQSLVASRGGVLRQTGALLVRGLAMGLAAREVAKTVRDYFSPWFATRRNAQGTLVREGREGAIKSWPGQAGMASAQARAAMLTETGAAHARTTRRIAERDGMGLQWHLSAGHADADECDDKQHRSSRGQDRGVYFPSEFPKLPSHPNCRCWSSVVPLRVRE